MATVRSQAKTKIPTMKSTSEKRQRWLLQDDATRHCTSAMRACRGMWDDALHAWVFTTSSDFANALSSLYAAVRAKRVTIAQREVLLDMIADGTAEVAWNRDMETVTGRWIGQLSRAEASRLITQGVAARRVLGQAPFDDAPARLSESELYDEAFERELQVCRARLERKAAR